MPSRQMRRPESCSAAAMGSPPDGYPHIREGVEGNEMVDECAKAAAESVRAIRYRGACSTRRPWNPKVGRIPGQILLRGWGGIGGG